MDKTEEKLARMTMTDAQFYKDGLADGLEICTKKIKELEQSLTELQERHEKVKSNRDELIEMIKAKDERLKEAESVIAFYVDKHAYVGLKPRPGICIVHTDKCLITDLSDVDNDQGKRARAYQAKWIKR